MTAIPYRIKGLSGPVRLGLFVLLFSASVFMQLKVNYFVGVVAAILSTSLYMAKAYTNKPNDLGLEEWKPVGMQEIDRVTDNLRQGKKLKIPGQYRAGIRVLYFFLFFALLFSFLIADRWDFLFFHVNFFIACLPFLFYGGVRIWVPGDLKMKMECVQAVLADPKPDAVSITPYLRFDKDSDGRMIPEDVRLMIEPKRKPADFSGIQLQAAINNGANGAVPYLYAVCLTKGREGSWRALSKMNIDGFELEAGGDGEYGTVVVRQDTGGGGYHTTKADCVRLFHVCVNILKYLDKAL